MSKPHKKRFLTYCKDCDGYFLHQPNEWMLEQMKLRNIDTWVIGKLCEHCLKKRKDQGGSGGEKVQF